MEQIYNILKEANENIKFLINKIEEQRINKEEDPTPHSAKDKTPNDSLRKRTRSSMRKKDTLELDQELSDMKEVVGRLLELEISATKMLRDIS